MRLAEICLFLSAIFFGSLVSAQSTGDSSPTMLFFDWGKAEVSRDSAGTLDALIATLGASPAARLTLESHSDRSGPAAANRLSALRRAEAVRDYLVARGISAGAIAIRVMGEDQPLIPTADGVREPQNRRVDVRVAGTTPR